MPSLDVACFVGGSYYFCVKIILKKKIKINMMKYIESEEREIDLEVNIYDTVC